MVEEKKLENGNQFEVLFGFNHSYFEGENTFNLTFSFETFLFPDFDLWLKQNIRLSFSNGQSRKDLYQAEFAMEHAVNDTFSIEIESDIFEDSLIEVSTCDSGIGFLQN